MDPATVVGLVSSAAALATLCGSAAKDLNTLVSKYKNAKLTILSMVQGLDTMQLAWSRIGKWAQNQAPDELLEEDDFIGRLRRSLETGSLVMDALNEELLIYKPLKMGITQRTKVVWNEGNLRIHQERIRDQASSMTLLLQAIHLPTSGDRNRLLRASEEQFGKSDESAYSIVPSRMSMSIYTGQTIDSGTSKSEVDLVYKPLTFENELFTARVYKRNYRTPTLQRLFKGTEQQTSDKTRSRTVAREIAEDPNGSEADACTIREPGPTRWWRTKAQNAEPRIPFADACEQGNVEIVEASLKSGQDVHLPVVRENQKLLDLSAIHVAAKGGHVKVVEILLRYGADKEMLSRVSQQRPLHVAVRAGHVAMAKYLLDNGTNVVALDSAGAQAIHLAAARRSTEMLSLLLERGAAIDSAVSTGYQPLHIASNIPDRANVIRFLCSQGADIEAKTHRGCTPLFYASARNYADNMKALLELGAAHIPQGLSDPSIMVQRSYLQATRLLLERGVDPNCPVYGERTALRRLAKALIVVSSESYTSHKFADVVELLVDLRDSNGDTPLHCLCRIRENPMSEQEELQLQLATILLRSTKDVDTINLAGDTALGLSIKRRCGISLIQSVFDSGGRLLLTKTEIKLRFEIDGSSAAYGSFLTCHLRRGDHVLTIRVNNYYKADQDSPHVLSPSSIGVLRGLLQDPQSIDVNDGSWSYDNGAYVPAAQ